MILYILEHLLLSNQQTSADSKHITTTSKDRGLAREKTFDPDKDHQRRSEARESNLSIMLLLKLGLLEENREIKFNRIIDF